MKNSQKKDCSTQTSMTNKKKRKSEKKEYTKTTIWMFRTYEISTYSIHQEINILQATASNNKEEKEEADIQHI